MKHILKKIDWLAIAQILLVSLLVFAPLLVVHGQGSQLPGYNCQPGQNCSSNIRSINDLIKTVVNWLLAIAFGVAVLFLIIGGFQYITSAGNEEAAEKGKGTAVNALIGIVIIVLSYVIVNVVANLVGNAGSNNASP
ncbi:MAG: hypothetical protein HYZ51_02470 [Candidatus Doudnabacteria bacterium]|nr:hypothetical protein [Candidatus Doudnabacteria bacterium]